MGKPMKPLVDTLYKQTYYCPNCREFLARKHDERHKKCRWCGQHIDWSKDNVG